MREIVYLQINGKTPYRLWFKKLDAVTQDRIRRGITRLTEGRFGDIENVGDNIFEMRFFFGKGYRVYFTEKDNKIIIIICGGDKKTQNKDIAKAKEYIKLI